MSHAQKLKLSIRQARYAAAIAAGKPALQELVRRGTQSLMQARVGMRSSSGPHPLKVSLLRHLINVSNLHLSAGGFMRPLVL